jgi:hypothetical protein
MAVAMGQQRDCFVHDALQSSFYPQIYVNRVSGRYGWLAKAYLWLTPKLNLRGSKDLQLVAHTLKPRNNSSMKLRKSSKN